MTDRRRAVRYQLARPAAAEIRLFHDVVVEHSTPDHLTVVSAVPCTPGEELSVRVRSSDGRTALLRVRTVATRPVLGESAFRYRLDLQVLGTMNRVPASGDT
jgi:hypothetical protein